MQDSLEMINKDWVSLKEYEEILLNQRKLNIIRSTKFLQQLIFVNDFSSEAQRLLHNISEVNENVLLEKFGLVIKFSEETYPETDIPKVKFIKATDEDY